MNKKTAPDTIKNKTSSALKKNNKSQKRSEKLLISKSKKVQKTSPDGNRAEEYLRKVHQDLEKRKSEQTAALKNANEQITASNEGVRGDLQWEQESMEDRLRFEMLLADISARFVNLPADQIDNEIEGAMHDVCDFLDLDLSALWQWSGETSGFFTMTHLHRPLGGPPAPERMNAQEYYPWSLQQVMAGKVIALSSIDDAPAEAARDKEVWRHYGIKTTLTIPLSVGGETPIGAVSFNTMLAERIWPEALVKRLQLVAQVFTNALARKKADRELRESEARLSLAANAAGAGLWGLNLDSRCFWLTKKTRELFDFTADEVVTFERFLSLVHPEDRELIRQTVQAVVQSKKEGSVEYRIIRADGSVRWMASRGRVQCNVSGGPDYLMGVSVDITERKRMENQLKEQLQEIEKLKQRLESENVYLKEKIKLQYSNEEIIGGSKAIKRVIAQAEKVAQTESTVLITGETGTGKELIANAIHSSSKWRNRTMVKVDCASLPSALIESELFGREKGAYTGALTKQVGRFELADGSTIFLDEIGELPLELQSKLLRVLQDGEFELLGSPKTVHVNVRVIAATNRNLEEAIKKGTFREDLYYRLKVFPIEVPPLREHQEDIPLLVQSFLNEFTGKMGKKIRTVTESTLEMLKQYHWPGNVRELRNIIEQAVIVTDGDILQVTLPQRISVSATEAGTLEKAERQHIIGALEKTGWRIKGRNGAAELLGLKPSTLYTKMEKLGIPTNREKGGIST
jgi:PAS domain S-box-containing protein